MPKSVRIMHVLHAFSAGGLENGIVNIINGSPAHFEHELCLLSRSGELIERLIMLRQELVPLSPQEEEWLPSYREWQEAGPVLVGLEAVIEMPMLARIEFKLAATFKPG